MLRLGVDVGPVATLRGMCGGRSPDLFAAAHAAVLGGADVVHLPLAGDAGTAREEARRLLEGLDADVVLEVAPEAALVEGAAGLSPREVCLVAADGRALDVPGQRREVETALERLRRGGVTGAVRVEPTEEMLLAANEVGAEVVSLHTGRLAAARAEGARVHEMQAIRRAGATARDLGLRVQAGGGLDVGGAVRVAAVPEVEVVTVGSWVVSRAIFTGLAAAVRDLKDAILRAREVAERPEGL
jgi:pyridoxine 5-phosphate synthase